MGISAVVVHVHNSLYCCGFYMDIFRISFSTAQRELFHNKVSTFFNRENKNSFDVLEFRFRNQTNLCSLKRFSFPFNCHIYRQRFTLWFQYLSKACIQFFEETLTRMYLSTQGWKRLRCHWYSSRENRYRVWEVRFQELSKQPGVNFTEQLHRQNKKR